MAELRTEEEQVEALKKWWQENGKSLVLGVLLAGAIIFAWKGWQNNQQVKAETAAALYQNLIQAVALASAPQATEEQKSTAAHLAGNLKDDFDDTAYARFGALLNARLLLDAGDKEGAIAEFDWVLSQSEDPVMTVVTTMRKARVLASKGDVAAAITLLNGVSSDAFQVSLMELKGDLQLKNNEPVKARESYQQALDLAGDEARPILVMKLDNLAVEG
ncbi:YfgM family protein [Aliamphritea hakodatensis]|uniref:YfgM family protein n=1 Tax=Aliamphritea hakodatensis TaxID=2895352 RepID=UPI0022FD8A98|nr:tetratricopeptide repeat protein [Aliamphritea hakodatensis]